MATPDIIDPRVTSFITDPTILKAVGLETNPEDAGAERFPTLLGLTHAARLGVGEGSATTEHSDASVSQEVSRVPNILRRLIMRCTLHA